MDGFESYSEISSLFLESKHMLGTLKSLKLKGFYQQIHTDWM